MYNKNNHIKNSLAKNLAQLTDFSKLTYIGVKTMNKENKTFAEIVQASRRNKGWTVKNFIDRLGNNISAAYVTKIEVHGEIPTPSLVCQIAEILNLNENELLEVAKSDKIKVFSQSLEKKYQHAVGLYRLQRSNIEP
jgi:ribosome-binding protein aMBF1 (putative translation factor)